MEHKSNTDTENYDEAEIDEGLGTVYRVLGETYLRPPDKETVSAVEDVAAAVRDEGVRQSDDGYGVAEAVETVLDSDGSVDELRPGFTRVFRGLSRSQSPPPPYESLYRDGSVNGPTSVEVERFYAEAGYELAEDDTLVDHAGYELVFLAELCDRRDREKQATFIDDHLRVWLSDFHDAAAEKDVPGFYRGVFDLTEAVLRLHSDELEEGDG